MKPPKASAPMPEKLLYVHSSLLNVILQNRAEGATEDDLLFYQTLCDYLKQISSELHMYDKLISQYKWLRDFSHFQTEKLNYLQTELSTMQQQCAELKNQLYGRENKTTENG